MKKTTLILSAAIVLLMNTSCSTSAEKVKSAEYNAEKANVELIEANQEYLLEMEAYKKETQERIAINQKTLTDFKGRVEGQKKEALDEYNAKVAALETKNTDLLKKLADYKASGKDQWIDFKTEFNHDMEELGKSFNDFAVKNTK